MDDKKDQRKLGYAVMAVGAGAIGLYLLVKHRNYRKMLDVCGKVVDTDAFGVTREGKTIFLRLGKTIRDKAGNVKTVQPIAQIGLPEKGAAFLASELLESVPL